MAHEATSVAPISVALCEVVGLDPGSIRAIWYSHAGYPSVPVITAEVIVKDVGDFHVELQEFEVVPKSTTVVDNYSSA